MLRVRKLNKQLGIFLLVAFFMQFVGIIKPINILAEEGEVSGKRANLANKQFVVTLNPARVGTSNGIVSSNGLTEKEVNLDIALRVGDLLEKQGVKVIYTIKENKVIWQNKNVKYKGVTIPLELYERLIVANNAKSDILVNIGGNTSYNDKIEGVETYYYSSNRGSQELAKTLQNATVKSIGAENRGISSNSLNMIKLANMPSAWITVGFLSNKEEEKLLSISEYRQEIAEGIATGVLNYLEDIKVPDNISPVIKESTYELVQGEEFWFPSEMKVDVDGNGESTRKILWSNKKIEANIPGNFIYEGKVQGTNKKVVIKIRVIAQEDSNTNKPNNGKKRVVIDPGHGGYDPGAIGLNGAREKDIVLPVSLMVGEYLTKKGVEVIYTRNSDNIMWPSNTTQNLQSRVDISNKYNPDIFVSIHANKYTNSSAHGIETYYYQGDPLSEDLARKIQSNLVNDTGRYNRGIKSGNGLYVIRNTKAPAVLVELGFISNPTEQKLLVSEANQRIYANAVAKGILQCLGVK